MARPPGETRNSARSPSSLWLIRTPTLLIAVTSPFCRRCLNFGTVTGSASEASGLGSVLPAGPSGIGTATLAQRLNVFVRVFAAAEEAPTSDATARQPTEASTAILAQRILFIVLLP